MTDDTAFDAERRADDSAGLLASFRRRAALMALFAVSAAGVAAVPLGQWQIERDASERASEAVARMSARLPRIGAPQGPDAADLTATLQTEHLVGFELVEAGTGKTLLTSMRGAHSGPDMSEARAVRRSVLDPAGRQLVLIGYYHVPSALARVTSLGALWAMTSAMVGALIASVLGYLSFRRSLSEIVSLGDQLLESNLTLLRTLGSAVAHRDADTDSHNYRVALNAVCLGGLIGLSDRELRALTIGAFLHDIGKLAIPDAVLRKPGPLDRLERDVMKTHVHVGAQIAAGATWLAEARCVILHHHERFDGTGYPFGLLGTQIPRIARVFAVIDVFDALTASRPYKEAYSVASASDLIQAASGTHFDPDVCAVFLRHIDQFVVEQATEDANDLRNRLDVTVRRLFKDVRPHHAGLATRGGRVKDGEPAIVV